jgi:hypothetical protein
LRLVRSGSWFASDGTRLVVSGSWFVRRRDATGRLRIAVGKERDASCRLRIVIRKGDDASRRLWIAVSKGWDAACGAPVSSRRYQATSLGALRGARRLLDPGVGGSGLAVRERRVARSGLSVHCGVHGTSVDRLRIGRPGFGRRERRRFGRRHKGAGRARPVRAAENARVAGDVATDALVGSFASGGSCAPPDAPLLLHAAATSAPPAKIISCSARLSPLGQGALPTHRRRLRHRRRLLGLF